VPYVLASLGIYATAKESATKVTSLYIEAVKKAMPATTPVSVLFARISANPQGFGTNRAKFISILDTYTHQARGVARDVLHSVFFVARGSPPPFIKKEIAARIDSIHEMLKLKAGEAVIGCEHPVGREYDWPLAGMPIRFFPLPPGSECETIVKPAEGSASLQFLEALGTYHVVFVSLP